MSRELRTLSSFEPTAKLFERFRPMAHCVLNVVTEFRKTSFVTIRDEQRVITEAPSPARCKCNPAFAASVKQFCLQFKFVRAANRRGGLNEGLNNWRRCEDATKSSGAFFGRHILQQTQELGVVVS